MRDYCPRVASSCAALLLLLLTGCLVRPPSFGAPFVEACQSESALAELTLPEGSSPNDAEPRAFRIIARAPEGRFDFDAYVEATSQSFTVVGMTPYGNRGLLAVHHRPTQGAWSTELEVHPLWPKWLGAEQLLTLLELSLLPPRNSDRKDSLVSDQSTLREVKCLGFSRYQFGENNTEIVVDAPRGLTLVIRSEGRASPSAT